jgi:hypothetical protein
MRARVAYISSLGTTAILVAAALLMLVLVGALVAFRGWPGRANGAVVHPVPLGPAATPARAILVRPAASTKRIVRVGSFSRVAASRARLSTAGLVKRPTAPPVSGLVMTPAPAAPMTPASPSPPSAGPPPSPAPAAPAIAPPAPQDPGNPAPVGDPNGALSGVTLLDPGAPPPQSPTSEQVVGMVGELIGTPPPPMVGAVIDGLTRRR